MSSKTDYKKEKEKLKDFLTQFFVRNDDISDDAPSKRFTYMEQLQKLADREQVSSKQFFLYFRSPI